jgi:hypothetical protein
LDSIFAWTDRYSESEIVGRKHALDLAARPKTPQNRLQRGGVHGWVVSRDTETSGPLKTVSMVHLATENPCASRSGYPILVQE